MRILILLLLATASLATTDKYECLRNVLGFGDRVNGDVISLRGDYDVKTLMTFQHDEKVKKCNLNLEPAKKRCEGIYGEGKCEQLSASAYQTKCEQYFQRTGCCHCTMKCPENWTEQNYHCIKPEASQTEVFARKDECENTTKGKCETREGKWVGKCPDSHQRLGATLCVPVCPLGWHDEGHRCRKPANYRMAQPFFWQPGDN